MDIYNLINRANLLQEETTIDSISPSRIGSLIKEILLYINEYQLLASSPEIQKIYFTVSAMQSDGKPVSDLTGRSLNPGQLVVIVPESQTDATAGDVYRYDGPSGNTSAWTFIAKIGAVPADSELNASSTNPVQNKVVTEKLTELSGETDLRFSESKQSIDAITEKTDNDIKNLAEDISDFKSAIVTQIDKYKPIEINGDVVNAADEEDITSEDNLLKFKNRNALNGMGYVILRKNKTFAEQVTLANTIYEIRYDFILSSEFTMPNDCILKFVGGSVRGSKLSLNNTTVDADCRYGILPSEIDGFIANKEVFPEWLASSYDDDFTPFIQSLINVGSEGGVKIIFSAKEYNVSPMITLRSNVALESVALSKFVIDTDELYTSVIYSDDKIENVRIKGIAFEQTAERYETLSNGQVSRLIITCFNNSHNITIEDCQFFFNGTNAIAINGEESGNTIVRNNLLQFKRAHIANDREYDVSAIYVTDHYHRIEGNRITSVGGDFNKMGGGIETHGISGVVTNNVFDNCKVCINVVNDILPIETDEIGRIISSNTASNCNNFVCLWPVTSFPSLKNVKISDNVATGIKLAAIRSTIDRNSEVNGDVENIIITNNFFEGVHNSYDGNEYSPHLLDVFNMATIKLDTAGKISNFIVERNVIKSFPCSILWMSQYTREGEPKQEVVIKNNTIIDCFNSDRTIYYAAYYTFALFAAGRNAEVEITDNIIRIPQTIKLPPVLTYLHDGANMKFYRNIFPDIQTKMQFVSASNLESDLLLVRNPKLMYGYEEDIYVTGDTIYSRGNKAYCTLGGQYKDVQLTNTYAELENGVGFYTADNTDSLKIDYEFSTKVGTTPLLEKIAAIVGNKIYTNYWSSLRAYFGEEAKLSADLMFQKAQFAQNTVDIAMTPSFVTEEKGMMYFSLGASRPTWLAKSGSWVDVFGRPVVALQGTLAERPIAAGFAHMYMLTDSGNRKPIWKNSSGGDQWVSADGFNALLPRKGTTEQRPTPYDAGAGFTFYDSTLGKMILCNGAAWVYMDGTSL